MAVKKPDVPEVLKRAASNLLKWRGIEAMGGKDVLAWVMKDGTPAFAIQGPDLRLQARSLSGMKSMFNNRRYQLDYGLQRSLGLNVKLDYSRGYQPLMVGGAGQTMSEGMVSIDELEQGISSALDALLDEEGTHVTLMPMRGKPWNVGDKCTPYYSAKKRKVLCGTKPSGVIRSEKYDDRTGGYIKLPGVDFCEVADVVSENEGGIVGNIDGDPENKLFFLTHTLKIDTGSAQTAKAISRCGGMLYPSLAIADVPATNFGPVCLFARIPLAIRVLKPYKTRSRGPLSVTVYNTDAWTDVTRDFIGSRSIELFDQLTGRWEIRYGENIMTLGPRMMEDARSFGPEVKRLTSVSSLRSTLNRKRKRWHEGMTAKQIEDASDGTDLKYPYCEVKVNGILQTADTFPLAVCPSYMKARASKFLTAIGFNGVLLTVPVKGHLKDMLEDKWMRVEEAAKGQWDYAWLVREKVLEWVEKHDSNAKTYETWLQYLDVVDHGFLGKYGPVYSQPKLVRSNPANRYPVVDDFVDATIAARSAKTSSARSRARRYVLKLWPVMNATAKRQALKVLKEEGVDPIQVY